MKLKENKRLKKFLLSFGIYIDRPIRMSCMTNKEYVDMVLGSRFAEEIDIRLNSLLSEGIFAGSWVV